METLRKSINTDMFQKPEMAMDGVKISCVCTWLAIGDIKLKFEQILKDLIIVSASPSPNNMGGWMG